MLAKPKKIGRGYLPPNASPGCVITSLQSLRLSKSTQRVKEGLPDPAPNLLNSTVPSTQSTTMHLRPNLLLTLSFLVPRVISLANPEPVPIPEPQIAQGGGIVAPSLATTQAPTVTTVPSLTTSGGVVTAVQVVFTQTFASTALGTWALGDTPKSGIVGLGSLAGGEKLGIVKTET